MIMYLKPSTRAIHVRTDVEIVAFGRPGESSDVSLECLLSLRTCGQERKELSKLQLSHSVRFSTRWSQCLKLERLARADRFESDSAHMYIELISSSQPTPQEVQLIPENC